jgi:hypothetical protein
MKRKPIEDVVFGTLTWDDRRDWWVASVPLTPKHEVEVTVDWDEEEPLTEVLARCRAAFLRLRNDEWGYRLATADELLELYNDTRRQSDAPEETRESFARKLKLHEVGLNSDGSADLWYDSETDFFCGHAINGCVDADGVLYDADIPG